MYTGHEKKEKENSIISKLIIVNSFDHNSLRDTMDQWPIC